MWCFSVMFIWSKWKCHPVQNWTFHSHCDTYLCWWKLCIPKFLLNLFILYKQYYHLHLHVLYCLTCPIPACNRIFCQVTKMTQVKVCCLSFLGCPCHLFLKFLFVKILTSWVNHLKKLEQSLFYLVHWCIYKINIRLMTDRIPSSFWLWHCLIWALEENCTFYFYVSFW